MKNTLTIEGKQEILDRLDKLTETSTARWGSMKVNQMLAHMNDAHKIALGMKPSVDTSNFYTHYIKFPVALLLPSWPKNESTAPELDQTDKGTKAKDFYTELEFLKKMMDIFGEREASKIHPHPLFGKLTKTQWSDLLKKHFDHHLRQFGV
jgi:hypothetical protein